MGKARDTIVGIGVLVIECYFQNSYCAGLGLSMAQDMLPFVFAEKFKFRYNSIYVKR